MKHPEEICEELVLLLDADTFTFYYGSRPDQNFEADEFTYPAVFLDKPIKATIRNTISNARYATVNMVLFFAYKVEIDATEPEKFAQAKQTAWTAAREFVLRLRRYDDYITDVKAETLTDVDHVFDINLAGCLLEVTVEIKDVDPTCIDAVVVSPPVEVSPPDVTPPVEYDADAQAYFDALPEPISDARKEIINDMVLDLKATGNWDELEQLAILANENEDNALIDLMLPSRSMINVNTATFVVDEGFYSGGINGYIDWNLPVNTMTKLTTNSSCIFVYNRLEPASSSYFEFGARDSGYATVIYLASKYFDGTVYAENNCINVGNSGNYVEALRFHASRRDSSTHQEYWHDDTLIYTVSRASSGRPPVSLHTNGLNGNGVHESSNFATQNYSIIGCGSGNVDVAALYNTIQTYMTAIGKQV